MLIGVWELEIEIEILKFPLTAPISTNMTTQVADRRFRQTLAPKCSGATVMIVDDDEYFRALARSILEPGGFQIIEADGVTACLLALRSRVVDAVILDMVMPDRDG